MSEPTANDGPGPNPATVAGSSPTSISGPSRLGDFRIVREVGRGGMGVVYEAEQMSLGRRVALKVLPANLLVGEKQRSRFLREARAAARLHHTNIVPVFGVGEQDGLSFYAMQFIDGQTLDLVLSVLAGRRDEPQTRATVSMPGGDAALEAAQVAALTLFEDSPANAAAASSVTSSVADKKSDAPPTLAEGTTVSDRPSFADLDKARDYAHALAGAGGQKPAVFWKNVARLGTQVAGALQHAHDHGILHRDIKPGNLLLDAEGVVWVTDFGLAKGGDEFNLTQTGDLLGTLRYMPPEAFEGSSDARADVYALGLTLYELLALRPAYGESDRNALVRRVLEADCPRLESIDASIPRDLATVVHKAIEREAGNRYQTAAEFGADLWRFLRDEPILARRISVVQRAARWTNRNRALSATLSAVAGLILLLALGSAAAAIYFRRSEGEQRRLAEEMSRLARDKTTLAQERQEALDRSHTMSEGLRTTAARLNTSLGVTESLRRESDEQRALVRRNLYQAEMKVAARLWETPRGRLLFDDVLTRWKPSGDDPDLRGWEWYYLRSLTEHAERTIRPGKAPLFALRWSPSGERLACAARSTTEPLSIVRRDGVVEQFLDLAGARAADIAWSPGEDRVAAACADRVLRIYDRRSGALSFALRGHDHPLACVAWSADGRLLATGDEGGFIKLWDAREMTETASWRAHGRVASLSLDSASRRLASAGDRHARVWRLTDRKLLYHLDHDQPVACVRFSPDGKRLATTSSTSDGRRVYLWNAETAELESAPLGHFHWTESLDWSADSRRFATVSRDQTLALWTVGESAATHVVRGFPDELASVAFHPKESLAAAAGNDGAVTLWNLPSRQTSRTLDGEIRPMGLQVEPICFSPDGRWLASSAGLESKEIRLWPFRDAALREAERDHEGESSDNAGPIRLTGEHQSAIEALAWSPRGDLIASADRSAQIVVWDPTTRHPLRRLEGHASYVNSLAFSADGLLASASDDQTVRIWDPQTGKELRTLRGHGPGPGGAHHGVTFIAWSHDGKQLASVGADGWLRWWSDDSDAPLRELAVSNQYLICVAFSPDGKRLATGGADRLLRVWRNEDGQLLATGSGHTDWLRRLAWSADGARIATCNSGGDIDVKIWDSVSCQEILRLPGFGQPVRDVVFSPSGMVLAASQNDGVIRLFDAAPGYAHERSEAILAPLEKRIATAGDGPIGDDYPTEEATLDELAMRMEILDELGRADAARQAFVSLKRAYELFLAQHPGRVDRAQQLGALLLAHTDRWSSETAVGERESVLRATSEAQVRGYSALAAAYAIGRDYDAAAKCFSQDLAMSEHYRPRAAIVAVAQRWPDVLAILMESHGDLPEIQVAAARQCRERRDFSGAQEGLEKAIGALQSLAFSSGDDPLAAELVVLLDEAESATWRPMMPAEYVAESGAVLTPQSDASLVVSGARAAPDSYMIALESDLPRISGVRLEALVDPSFPNNGPGRNVAGNFVLTGVAARVRKASGEETPIALERAAADYTRPPDYDTTANDGPQGAIDDSDNTHWDIWPHVGRDHWLAIQFKTPVDLATGDRLIVELGFRNPKWGCVTLGRFRLSATDRLTAVLPRRFRSFVSASETSGFLRLAATEADRGNWVAAAGAARQAIARQPSDPDVGVLGNCIVAEGERNVEKNVEKNGEMNGPSGLAAKVAADQLLAQLSRRKVSDELRPLAAETLASVGSQTPEEVDRIMKQADDDAELADAAARIERDPRNADAFSRRAHHHARHGEFALAVEDFRIALGLSPDNAVYVFYLGNALVADGNSIELAALGAWMLDRFGDTTQPIVAERFVKILCALPDIVPPERMDSLTVTALAAGPEDSAFGWFLLAGSMHAYRSGLWQVALQSAQLAREREGNAHLHAIAHAVESLSWRRLGDETQAAEALANARTIHSRFRLAVQTAHTENAAVTAEWNDYIVAKTLIDEAEKAKGLGRTVDPETP